MGNQREEPQAARGEPGSRDTGSDTVAGGPTEREPGDIGHEETTSAHGTDSKRRTEFTTTPGSSAEPATPPYEGRKQTANEPDETATGKVDDANVGGATAPTEGEG
ncbi:hypothetical protein OHB12_13505 [Nocardia sp. NBC_01730]|uniref:hypothetical protein n=1 Tax=Nocardia sp. NBC_01730 TaxID=2975998 RepID=UPI002E126A68|nr:hypothetical protein OHB12_13505 [Nocardia sp. NBC_01730]